jgi:putative transposase
LTGIFGINFDNFPPSTCSLEAQYVKKLRPTSVSYTLIRKEFPDQVKRFYWNKPIFWHSAYFIATCGGVTVEQLKRYVQQQESPSDAEVVAKGSSRPRRKRGRGGDSRG